MPLRDDVPARPKTRVASTGSGTRLSAPPLRAFEFITVRSPGDDVCRLCGPFLCNQRFAERLKQFPVHGVLLRVVFGVPLHAERKGGRIADADRLDGAVVGYALDDHA